jgi:hypothetical protein
MLRNITRLQHNAWFSVLAMLIKTLLQGASKPIQSNQLQFYKSNCFNDDQKRRTLDRNAEHEYYYPVSQKLVVCLQHPQTELWGRGGGVKLRGAAYQYSQERWMQQAPQPPLHAVSLSILKTQLRQQV